MKRVNFIKQGPLQVQKSSKHIGCTTMILFLILSLILFTFYYSKIINEKSYEKVSLKKNNYSCSFLSSQILSEVHEKKSVEFHNYQSISGFSLNMIEEINYYYDIEHWKTAELNTPYGYKFDYKTMAKRFNIPQLQARDLITYFDISYYPELNLLLRNHYENHPIIVLDYYHPLQSTAYCGLYTFVGGLVINSNTVNGDLDSFIVSQLRQFVHGLPEWISGFKLHYTTYVDDYLGIEESLDIGYLWKRDDSIRKLSASIGLFGYERPSINNHWHTPEWNNRQVVNHPKYSTIDLFSQ